MPDTLIDRRFEIKESLGRSDMGELHLATDSGSGEMLALKRFGARVDARGEDWHRFARAVRRAAGLHHPHLLVPMETGISGGRGYQVTSYFPAEPLPQAIAGGALKLSQIAQVVQQVAQGLAALHQRGLAHGNLKPGNVLVSRDGDQVQAVSVDPFLNGLRSVEDALLRDALAPWHAPEAAPWLNRAPDARADLYVLGTLAYWMLTGRLPFSEGAPVSWIARRLTTLPPPPREWNAHVPERLSAIVMRLLARNPDERFSSAEALVEALREWSHPERGPLLPAGRPFPPPPGVHRVPLAGREGAREAVLSALSNAHSGRGSLVLLEGEAGSGRGTVIESLRIHVESTGALVLGLRLPREGWCAPFQAPAELFQELLRRWVFLPDPRRRDLLYGLHSRIGEHAALWTGLLPESATLLPDAAPLAPMPVERQRLRMLSVLADTFPALASPAAPLILALGGLERLDADSLDWLRHLFHRLPHHPLLVIATSPPVHALSPSALGEWLYGIERDPALLRIPVPPLTRPQTEQALAAELGWAPGESGEPAAAVAEALHRQWRGLPLGQALTLDLWKQGERLEWKARAGEAGHWAWRALDSTPEPDTLTTLIEAWLASLPDALYQVLEPAAVLPGAFVLEGLSALLPDIPLEVLGDRLESLVERGALARTAQDFRFVHERLRDVVYRRIAPLRRLAWHQAAGAHAEAGMLLHAPLARLVQTVRHFEAGEELARAIEQGLLAAEEARHHHALHAACRELEALLASLRDDPRSGTLFAALGESRARLGDLELAEMALNEALRRASSAAHQADTLGMLARVAMGAGRRDEALRHIEEALRLLGESLPARPMGTVLARLATGASTRYHQLLSQASGAGEPPLTPDEERLARLLELASLALHEHHPSRAALADERILSLSAGRLPSPLTVRALIRLGAGDPAALDQAAALAEARHLPHEAARVRLARARADWVSLNTGGLHQDLQSAAVAFRALGDPLGEAEALLARLPGAAWQGPAEAIAVWAEPMHVLATLAGDAALRARAEGWRAFGEALEGTIPPADALPSLTRIAESLGAAGDVESEAEQWGLVAELYLLAGQPQSATSAAQQGIRASGGSGDPMLRALLAEALLASVQLAFAAGADVNSPWREAKRLMRALAQEARTDARLSVQLMRLEVMDDILAGQSARAIARAEEGVALLESQGLRLPAAQLAFRTAQALKTAGHADWLAWAGQALTRFDALGARLGRTTTRHLLDLADTADGSAAETGRTARTPWPEGLSALIEPLLAGAAPQTSLPRDLLRWLAGETDAERAALYLPDADGEPVASVSVPAESGTPPWINHWLVERVWEEGRARRLEHYQPSDPATGARGPDGGEALSVLCVPLLRDGTVLGAAYLASSVSRQVFGEAEQLRAEALATQAAMLLSLADTLGGLRAEREQARRDAAAARERAEWALAVSTIEDGVSMLEAFLRDVAEPRGYPSALAFRLDRGAQRLAPMAPATLGRAPLETPTGADLASDAARRARHVLERQQPGALRHEGGESQGWEAELLRALGTRRGLWLPLVSRGESEGVLLLGHSGASAASPPEDTERELFASLRAITPLLIQAWERDRLTERSGSLSVREEALERTLDEARTFLPPPLRTRLDSSGTGSLALTVTEERAFAIAGDILGWDAMSAAGAPAALATLDEYLALAEEALALHHAKLVYVRDGVWLARGERGAESALWAAQAVVVLLRRWQTESERPWPRRLRTGIGIHVGSWSDAVLRAGKRQEAAALGPGPAVARGLARLNFRFHTDVLVSQAARDALAEGDRFELRPLGSQRLTAGARRTRYFEYFGTRSRDLRERMLASRGIWEDALRYYREGTWGKAAEKLRVFLAAHPDDRPARLFLKICRERMG